jgi:hypothetical protein
MKPCRKKREANWNRPGILGGVLLFGALLLLAGGCAESEAYRRSLAEKIQINSFLLFDLTDELAVSYMQIRNRKSGNWKELRTKLENLEKMVPLLRDQSRSARDSKDDRLKQLCGIEDELFRFFHDDILKMFFSLQTFLESTTLTGGDRDHAIDDRLREVREKQDVFRGRKTAVEDLVKKLFPMNDSPAVSSPSPSPSSSTSTSTSPSPEMQSPRSPASAPSAASHVASSPASVSKGILELPASLTASPIASFTPDSNPTPDPTPDPKSDPKSDPKPVSMTVSGSQPLVQENDQ